MPNYRYRCDTCEAVKEQIRTIEERNHALACEEDNCDGFMKLVICPTAIKVWHYDPCRMDAEAEMKQCGVER